MAERHPRDLDVVREKLLKECRRPGFAKVARYNKPIGGGVKGLSIRFAEAAIRIMGNISVDQMTVFDDREKRIIRVIVVDCEANIPYSSDITIDKTVERRSVDKGADVIRTRQNKTGQTLYIISATEDDLLNKQNAQVSKAIRNNGLRLIPGDIQEECEDEVIKTQSKADAADPDAAKRKLFDAFGQIGVPVDQLKIYLGHDANTVSPAELNTLRGYYTGIRDGETSWREIMEERFPVPEPTTPPPTTTQTVKEQIISKAKQKREEAAPAEITPADIWPKEEEEEEEDGGGQPEK